MTASDDAGDDDHELDAMMSSMRGVWREMRDEEPPARGLDALLAAARTKAVEMAPEPERESWWRRAMAMLVRPPVLAAATVVVLVGTTVLLSRRDALDTVAPARTASDTANARERDRAARPEHNFEAGETKGLGKDDLDGKLGAGAGVPGAGSPAVGGKPVRRPAVVRAPSPPPPPTDPATTDEFEKKAAEGSHGLAEDSPAPVETKLPSEPSATQEALELKPGSRVPQTGRTAPTAKPTPAPIDQLVKQAELAASRNDCAAVRGTAERIKKLDAAAYKTRVLTQPALKRCL